jgi:hypothetical protein
MSEKLGDAVLDLRTDDSAFTAGINRAEVAATGLGRTLDATSGSSLALADRMTRSVPAIDGVTRASGAQRQGLLQLTQQLGDASTMYALGMRPQQIFASQVGQVAGAIQLLAGEGSKFARFLGGPWGIAIMVGVQVLGPLIGSLLAADEAMKKVELASDGLADAQGVLGRMFDLTTGKLKSQNEMLRLNAELMAINLRAQAAAERRNATSTLDNFRRGSVGLSMTEKAMGALGIPVGGSLGREDAVRQLVEDIRSGRVNNTDAARRAAGMDFSGLAVSREQFLKAIADGVSGPAKDKVADAIEKSLNDGALDPSLRTSGRSKKAKAGKSQAEIDAEFLSGITSLNRDELQARLALASDVGERLEIQKEILNAERDDKIRTIDANKNFSTDQKAAMRAYIDRLYGRDSTIGPNGEIVTEGRPGLLNQGLTRQFEAEQTKLANDMLQRQAETAQASAQVARSTRERAMLEAEALRLQQQIQDNLLEQQIATGQVADAEKARAELRSQQAAARRGLSDRYAGPLDQYADQLAANKEDSARRVEALMVEELDYVHRSIGDTISARLGVEDPFLRGLIDMFVEDVFIRPFAEALQKQKGGGGGGGLFSSLFSGLFGGGGGASPQASLAGDVAATIGSSQFAGLFAEGGTIPNGAWGIVGEAGPEPIRATGGGIEVLPNSALRGMGGGGPGVLKVEVIGARGNAEIEAMVRSGVAQGLAAYDSKVAARVADYNNRRTG